MLGTLRSVILQKNVFLVSALARINSDIKSRYLILIDGEYYSSRLTEIFFNYIPVYSVTISNELKEEGKLGRLSYWFREIMGRGFSFIDIDYLLVDEKYHKVVIIEEKIGNASSQSVGYGQWISYKELITDVIAKPNVLLFIFASKIKDPE